MGSAERLVGQTSVSMSVDKSCPSLWRHPQRWNTAAVVLIEGGFATLKIAVPISQIH